jgi:hypothetical protein
MALDRLKFKHPNRLFPILLPLNLRLLLQIRKGVKSPGVNQILPVTIQAGEETLCFDIHKLTKLIYFTELP